MKVDARKTCITKELISNKPVYFHTEMVPSTLIKVTDRHFEKFTIYPFGVENWLIINK